MAPKGGVTAPAGVDVAEYCRIHAKRAEAEGLTKTALVLEWAADEIEALRSKTNGTWEMLNKIDAQLQRDALALLKDALRYVEVKTAYVGAMTPAQVETEILNNRHISEVAIGANSVTTLARFNIAKAREVIAKMEAA